MEPVSWTGCWIAGLTAAWTTSPPAPWAAPPGRVPPDCLAIAIRCLSEAIRIHKRMAKREPHLFDYATIDRNRREAAARQQREAECQAALDRVYGTPLEDLLAGKTQNGAKTVQKSLLSGH